METNNPKALIYTRVSSKRQEREGHGLESQEYRCQLDAEFHGNTVEKVFYDSYTGGGNFMNRPAMKKLLAYVDVNRSKKYVVIFDDLKRFARDLDFHRDLRKAFKKRKVELRCLNFKFEETPEGEFVEVVIAAQGELERKQNRRQVIEKMQARLESGYWVFNAPTGYIYKKNPAHGKLITPHKTKAAIIQEALEGFASDRFLHLKDVQKFLSHHRLLGNRPVRIQYIHYILKNILYAGYIEFPPWNVRRKLGHHKPIISLSTYELVQDKLSGKTKGWHRQDVREDFPLRGLLVCALCHGKITASWSSGRARKYPYYRCHGDANCPFRNKSIAKKIIEKQFEKILFNAQPEQIILSKAEIFFWDLHNEGQSSVKAIDKKVKQELQSIERTIEGLIKKIPTVNSDIVLKIYNKEIDDLGQKALSLQNKLSQRSKHPISFGTALELVFSYLKNPYDKWVNGNIHEKRLVFELVFADMLDFHPEKGFGTTVTTFPYKVFDDFSQLNCALVDITAKTSNNSELPNSPDWEKVEQKIFHIAERIREHQSK